jgi:hypothetical protein
MFFKIEIKHPQEANSRPRAVGFLFNLLKKNKLHVLGPSRGANCACYVVAGA